MKKPQIDKVWKDRKRFLGMPLSFTRYSLSEDRLFLSTGFLTIHDDEVLLYRIRDITTSRTLWQRLFGVGTVKVVSSDKTTPELILKNVKNPIAVKELLHQYVEDMKIRRKVRIGEITSSSDGDGCCHHDHDDDMDDADDNLDE